MFQTGLFGNGTLEANCVTHATRNTLVLSKLRSFWRQLEWCFSSWHLLELLRDSRSPVDCQAFLLSDDLLVHSWLFTLPLLLWCPLSSQATTMLIAHFISDSVAAFPCLYNFPLIQQEFILSVAPGAHRASCAHWLFDMRRISVNCMPGVSCGGHSRAEELH